MSITDKDGLWRLTDRCIENRRTGEVKVVHNMPSANSIALMAYSAYLRGCQVAFQTGEWP